MMGYGDFGLNGGGVAYRLTLAVRVPTLALRFTGFRCC